MLPMSALPTVRVIFVPLLSKSFWLCAWFLDEDLFCTLREILVWGLVNLTLTSLLYPYVREATLVSYQWLQAFVNTLQES